MWGIANNYKRQGKIIKKLHYYIQAWVIFKHSPFEIMWSMRTEDFAHRAISHQSFPSSLKKKSIVVWSCTHKKIFGYQIAKSYLSVFGLTLQQRLAAKYQEEEGGTWCHEIFRMCMRFRQTAARKKWVVSSSNNFCSGKMIAVMPCDATQILSSLVTWSRHLPFQEFCNISMGWFSKQNDKDNLLLFYS